MAQFDVHLNPSTRQRDAVPYVVDVQSALLDHLPTRWVVPLVIERFNAGGLPQRLCPRVEVDGKALFAWPQQTAPVLHKALGRPLASLRSDGPALLDALDAVTSGI